MSYQSEREAAERRRQAILGLFDQETRELTVNEVFEKLQKSHTDGLHVYRQAVCSDLNTLTRRGLLRRQLLRRDAQNHCGRYGRAYYTRSEGEPQ